MTRTNFATNLAATTNSNSTSIWILSATSNAAWNFSPNPTRAIGSPKPNPAKTSLCQKASPAVTKNTDKRCITLENGEERCKTAIQTNNVEVDDRGYIYAVDRANTGLHILELTGEARRIANFPQ